MAEVQSTMAADGETASTLIEQSLPPVVTDGETTTTVIDAAVAPPNITSVLPPSTTSVLHQPARVSIVSGRPRSWKLAARMTLNGYPQFGDIEAEDLSFWLERIDDIAPRLYSAAAIKAFQQTIPAKDKDFIDCLMRCLSRSTVKPGHGARLFCRLHDNGHATAFVATLETEALNRFRDADGRRVFNARHFHLEGPMELEKIEMLEEAMTWAKEFDGRVHTISDGIAEVEDRHGYAATLIDEALEKDDQKNIDALTAQITWLKWRKFENRLVVRNVSTCTYLIDNSQVVVIDDLEVADPRDDPPEEPPSQLGIEFPMAGPAASSDFRQARIEHFQAPRTSMGIGEKGVQRRRGVQRRKGMG